MYKIITLVDVWINGIHFTKRRVVGFLPSKNFPFIMAEFYRFETRIDGELVRREDFENRLKKALTKH